MTDQTIPLFVVQYRIFIAGGKSMGQEGKNAYSKTVFPNRSASRSRSVRNARNKKRRKRLTFVSCILAISFVAIFALKPASASTKTLLQSFHVAEEAEAAPVVEEETADSIVQIQPVEDSLISGSSDFALRDANALSIVSWQGAKNCGDSFPVTLKGVEEGQSVRFAATNCTVFPQNGTADDTYTVTITGAGAYSLTAMTDDELSDGMRDTRTGIAGKADQLPLTVSGWGGAKDYYHSFNINVFGGSTGGAITFEADGCTVSPSTGTSTTNFTVTVTRVGSYELTAVMDGNDDYNSAHSACMSGCSSKADQSEIHIDDWVSEAVCNDTFNVKIYGGSTSEALSIEPLGCTVEQLSSDEYQVQVTTVGPYALTASRAGNYGYYTASTSVSGVSEKASAPTLSLSGWSDAKNCNDSFPIRINGGVADATIHFSASGCTVSPSSGTTDTNYTVTVTSAGGYSLTASMDGTNNYKSATTRTYRGESGMGVQSALRIENWIDSAPAGSSFEITVAGGSGTGATSVTTDEGCTARLKSGETNVYVVSVYPLANTGYSITVGKAGDASFDEASIKTVSGTTTGANQTALSVTGWNESVYSGDSFEIKLSGGSGTGAISFEASGCKVTPTTGAVSDTYTVSVTARENEAYSLRISHAGDDNYALTSVLHSGNVRPYEKSATETLLDPVTFGTYSWVYICGGIVLLFAFVLLMMQFTGGHRRRHHHR